MCFSLATKSIAFHHFSLLVWSNFMFHGFSICMYISRQLHTMEFELLNAVLFFELQSLMIAAIPNILGWLAISFAKVSNYWNFMLSVICFPQAFHCKFYDPFVGFLVFVYGKVVGRFWCGYNLLHGNFVTSSSFHYSLS